MMYTPDQVPEKAQEFERFFRKHAAVVQHAVHAALAKDPVGDHVVSVMDDGDGIVHVTVQARERLVSFCMGEENRQIRELGEMLRYPSPRGQTHLVLVLADGSRSIAYLGTPATKSIGQA